MYFNDPTKPALVIQASAVSAPICMRALARALILATRCLFQGIAKHAGDSAVFYGAFGTAKPRPEAVYSLRDGLLNQARRTLCTVA